MITLSQCPGIDAVKDSSAALQAAVNQKQPITWDCPVAQVAGADSSKSVFLPPGTNIVFVKGKGMLSTDAVGFPALAVLHASAVLSDLHIRYTGTPGVALPNSPNKWTDVQARQYLVANKLNTFQTAAGTYWTGPTNTSALLSIRGQSNVSLLGLTTIDVAADTPAWGFPLTAIGVDPAYAVGATCGGLTPPPLVVPDVTCAGLLLDGSIMGVVGGGGAVEFAACTRARYADLEDAAGGNIGGAGTWAAPPHFFYLQGSAKNKMTAKLVDIVDLGIFCGAGRRSVASGYMHSIKLELANGSSIERLYSRCLDGGLAVLSNAATTGGWVRDAICMVDTSIVDVNGKPAGAPGLFFPSAGVYPESDVEMSIVNAAAAWPVLGVPAQVRTRLAVRVGA